METKQYTTIDRAALGWPSGPWDGEPDKVQWPDAATGLPCLAVRHGRRGNWCGYVGVPEGHRCYGADYSSDCTNDLEVHGGITFGDKCQPGEDESRGVCHVPGAGEPEVWWLGFDCAHAWDWSPGEEKDAERGYPFLRLSDQVYRALPYVQRQCAALAEQLARSPT